MGRSISPMCETTVTGGSPRAAPRLIVPMSLRLAIPRRVALQQSSPPLHQPTVILKQKERLEKENPLNGKCASFRLSQLRGSPQKPVLLDRADCALAALENGPTSITTFMREIRASSSCQRSSRTRRSVPDVRGEVRVARHPASGVGCSDRE